MITVTQVTFRELLKDPSYKAWFTRGPKQPGVLELPWRVWVQREEGGKWGKLDFPDWKTAMRWVVRNFKTVHDLSLSCPSRQFPPPVLVVGHRMATQLKDGKKLQVRVPIKERWTEHHTPLEHVWCGMCRRPTVFGFFRRHHAMPNRTTIPYKLRCRICGCSMGFQRYR